MSRYNAFVRLNQELNTLAAFDRLYDFIPVHDSAQTLAHELRQTRRSQIAGEIEKLKHSTKRKLMHHVRVSSALILLFAVGYAFMRYLFSR